MKWNTILCSCHDYVVCLAQMLACPPSVPGLPRMKHSLHTAFFGQPISPWFKWTQRPSPAFLPGLKGGRANKLFVEEHDLKAVDKVLIMNFLSTPACDPVVPIHEVPQAFIFPLSDFSQFHKGKVLRLTRSELSLKQMSQSPKTINGYRTKRVKPCQSFSFNRQGKNPAPNPLMRWVYRHCIRKRPQMLLWITWSIKVLYIGRHLIRHLLLHNCSCNWVKRPGPSGINRAGEATPGTVPLIRAFLIKIWKFHNGRRLSACRRLLIWLGLPPYITLRP